jgi:CelD/BcsL family acetyltransferase involved in cellulose biosynthesis
MLTRPPLSARMDAAGQVRAWPLPGELAGLLGFSEVEAAAAPHPVEAGRVTLAECLALADEAKELAARATNPNPFLLPAALAASFAGKPDRAVILTARAKGGGQLVGLWALARTRHVWSLGAPILQAPANPLYECQAAPLLAAGFEAEALAAMLRHVRAANDLPRTIRALAWPRALDAMLPAEARLRPQESWSRAMLAPAAGEDGEAYLRRVMGKALARRRRGEAQLASCGKLERRALRGEEAIAGFEAFVALEARGWKGREGGALAGRPEDVAYMRAMVAAFAGEDRLAVDVLSLDGEPIAVGVMIEAEGHNLFWKTAFDERFAARSPGALLHLAATERLFAEGRASLDSGMMEFTSPDFMPWGERAEMARVTLDQGGLGGLAARGGAALRHGLRRLQRRWKAGRPGRRG